MVEEVVEWLAPGPGSIIVDVTLGGAGHAERLLAETAPEGRLIGIDRDPEAIAAATRRLQEQGDRVTIVRARMSELGHVLDDQGITAVDRVLADLGVSSFQLDQAQRGLSFRQEGPLDMRMNPEEGETARELIARLDDEELANLIYAYGEERYSRRIARALKAAGSIATTAEAARIIERAVPPPARRGRIHPATRTFQALRIAVNEELVELERFLQVAPERLGPGGRMVVISYHSLEDRMVKRAFRARAQEEEYTLPVRRVVRASPQEVETNPRSRSACLRVIERRAE